MKKLTSILLLLVTVTIAQAQVPGYMGRKHLFAYSPSLSVFSKEYKANNDKGVSAFFLGHNFSYNYVIKKRMTIGIFYEYAGFDSYIGDVYFERAYVDVYGRFTKHQFGFEWRRSLRSRNLAPLGTYMKFTLSMINAKTIIDEEYYPAVAEDVNNPDQVYGVQSWDFAPGFGIGRQFIIARYIPLNFEIQAQVPFGSLFDYPELDIERAQITNKVGSTVIKFNIGIGILPF